MVGGRNFRESQFNLAVQAERQPGSSFKPFVLAAALQDGIAPPSTFVSRPKLISLGDKLWSVRNYENAYLGAAVTLAEATTHSDNAVYAELTQLVGPKAVATTARRLGIRSVRLTTATSVWSRRRGGQPARARPRLCGLPDGRSPARQPDLRQPAAALRGASRVRLRRGPEDRFVQARCGGRPRPRSTRCCRTSRKEPPPRGTRRPTGRRQDRHDRELRRRVVRRLRQPRDRAVWVGYPKTLRPMETEFNGDPVAGGTFPR